jgi:hypothetical protein|nr:MAG TPA: hypothetical protein [Crassvirales sp.]
MGKGIDLSMDAFIDENELFSPSVEEENDANEQPEALEDLGLEDTKKDSADEEIDPNNIFGTSQEEVGGEDDDNDIHQGQETEDASSDNDDKSGSNSPESTQFYSTILSSLRDDGILPDIDEDLIKTAKTPEDFATAIEKQVAARLDETQRRIKEALDNGVEPDEINNYEGTINYLNSIKEDDLSSDTEEAKSLRENLIYQDYLNRGFKPERAKKEVDKSITAGTDIEDAKSALESNKEYYMHSYQSLLKEQEDLAKEAKEQRRKEMETFSKKILDTEEPLSGVKVDQLTRKKILENATKPIYKDEEGNLMTSIQKYIKENPIDAQYYLNLFYTLTDGFKDINKLVKPKVAKTTKENIRSLESKLRNTNPFRDSGNDLFTDKESNYIKLDI